MKKILKDKIEKVIKNKYILGTVLVTIIYLMFLIINKAFPFGDKTILSGDAFEQYIKFFCYLKKILLNEKGIFMSWNLGMANEFYTSFVYYLINPINLIVIFFNNSNMYICFEIMLYIKLLLIFNFFVLYLEKVYNYKKIELVLFGIAYTYSSFVIVYYFNIMWLDVLYMLPLSAMFINNYINKNKLYPVVLSYIYMMFIQYYMGYSMIIFCSIYYIAQYWIINKFNKENFKVFMKKGLILALCTLLIVGMSMIILLPSLKQLDSMVNKGYDFIYTENLNISSILSNYTNKFLNDEGVQKLGFRFCGSLMLVLMIIFFLNKDNTIKEKLINLSVIFFLLLPVISPYLYTLWHGGAKTNGYNFRYTYLLIFLFVTIAFRGYQNIKMNKNKLILTCGTFGLLTAIEVISGISGYILNYSYNIEKLLISLAIIYTNIFLIYFFINFKKLKKLLFIFLLLVQIIEIGIVCNYQESGMYSIDEYKSDEKYLESISKYIDNPELERILFENDETGDKSLMYDYSTFYFFSSGRNLNVMENLKKIGYSVHHTGIMSDSKSIINDMMSGVKYYITSKFNNSFKDKNIFLKLKENIDEYDLYENVYALPFAYSVNDNLNIDDDKKVAEVQNDIMNSLGKKTNYKYFNNIEDSTNLIKYKKIEKKNDEFYFDNIIEYEFTALENIEIYLEYNCDKGNAFEIIYDNDERELNYSGDINLLLSWPPEKTRKEYIRTIDEIWMRKIISIKKGDKKKFKIKTNKESLSRKPFIFYVLDLDKVLNKMNSENKDRFKVDKINKDGLEGKISLEKDELICFQISYDEGWRIEIDGKEIEKEAIYGAFLGAKIPKGEHNVKLNFTPNNLKGGIIITVISSFILFAIIILHEYYNNRKKLK